MLEIVWSGSLEREGRTTFSLSSLGDLPGPSPYEAPSAEYLKDLYSVQQQRKQEWAERKLKKILDSD